MIRIIKKVSLLVFVCMIAMVLSCNKAKTTYQMMIIAQGDNSHGIDTENNLFTGMFVVNSTPCYFTDLTKYSPTFSATSGEVLYTVELTNIVSESKLSTLVITVNGTGTVSTDLNLVYARSIQYYLYKTTSSKSDLVDSAVASYTTTTNNSVTNYVPASLTQKYSF